MTSPTKNSTEIALGALSYAAQNNNATKSLLPLSVYTDAGVIGAQGAFLSAYNSALDSAAVNGYRADTTAEVQTIVDAYNTILQSTDGYFGQPRTLATAAQFAAIGVTGVSGGSGSDDYGTALHLLNDSLFGVGREAADTVAELQARADAAKRVMAATGGNAAQSARLMLADFAVLGVTGVTADSLASIRAVLRAVRTNHEVDSRLGLQDMVNAILGTSAEGARSVILAEAQFNSANATTLSTKVYATAGISGVDSSNLDAINSALNSDAFNAARALNGTQAMVDAYNAILRSAVGATGNNATALTGAQYSAVGVTGVSGAATDGSALHLLDSVVNASTKAQVDSVPELQALANAASHVIDAAGGTAAQAAALSAKDLGTLGITGVNARNIDAVRMALEATSSDNAVDTRAELQGVVNAALAPLAAGDTAARALAAIRSAAQYDSASASKPSLSTYAAAGVTRLLADNLASYNSALDSAQVDGAAVYTTAKVQALVDAYNTILKGTEGGFPPAVASAAQIAAVGVTGVSETSSNGLAFHLLSDALFGLGRAAVDTVPELQAIANAANHVLAAAGGTLAEAAALTVQDLNALHITGVTSANIGAIQTVMHAITNDLEVLNRYGVQTVVDATLGTSSYGALGMIGTEAELNSANTTTLSTSVYAAAGVHGVDSGNLSSINSALNSEAITGLLANTPQELQPIVDAYNAILQSADGRSGNTATALTTAQYAAVGVSVNVVAAVTANIYNLHLLDSVVDASTKAQVDTVPELQAIADAAYHVMTYAASIDVGCLPLNPVPGPLTAQELQTLGITGSFANHMDVINQALKVNDVFVRAYIDTQSELQSFIDFTIANGHAPSHPIPLDDPLVPAVAVPVVVDPSGGGSVIDWPFTVCLFGPVSPVDATPLEVGVATQIPASICVYPIDQLPHSVTLGNQAVLLA